MNACKGLETQGQEGRHREALKSFDWFHVLGSFSQAPSILVLQPVLSERAAADVVRGVSIFQ